MNGSGQPIARWCVTPESKCIICKRTYKCGEGQTSGCANWNKILQQEVYNGIYKAKEAPIGLTTSEGVQAA
eukprot:1162101-Pelagomonas_calceolata.AAC.15